MLQTTKGWVLDVSILDASPMAFELEVSRSILLNDSEIFVCKIRNVLAAEELSGRNKSVEQLMKEIAPVKTTLRNVVFVGKPHARRWGEPMKSIKNDVNTAVYLLFVTGVAVLMILIIAICLFIRQ